MKRIPLGVDGIVEANKLYYVDKTRILKDIIDFGIGKTMLFTRPRRFGKSLALSMMECFFRDDADHRSYFEGTEIFSYAFCNHVWKNRQKGGYRVRNNRALVTEVASSK